MNAPLAWAVVIPLLGAGSCLVAGRGTVRGVAGATILGTLLAAIVVTGSVASHGTVHHRVGGWGAPLGIELRADGIASVMLLAAAVVGALISLDPLGRMGRHDEEEAGFLSLWFFAWAALNALLLSADVFNLYVCLELATLAAVGLIALGGDHAAIRAALHYLLIALPGSLLYLLGVGLHYGEYATLDIGTLGLHVAPTPGTGIALALMTGGLCLKAALFPLHGWLPAVYVHSRYPVSALLAALVGKGSFYVLLRVWMGVTPAELMPGAGGLLGLLGAAGILWGSVQALGQTRLKPLLAYSSVAQIGYLFLVFPLSTPAAWSGGVYLAVSHAAAKASMFLAAAEIHRVSGSDELANMTGRARDLPIGFAALALSGMSLMGMPPTGGFVAKWLLVRVALEEGRWWLAAVILAGGLLAAAYMFRVLRIAFLPVASVRLLNPPRRGAELIALALALFALGLGLFPSTPLAIMQVGPSR
ncbi:MAG: complex I subunit 5 family protein [Myxococcota bacterium]